MTALPAAPADFAAILALLAESGLPTTDLAPDDLANFLVIPSDRGIAGTVGLELFPPDALLRSLAVVADRRDHGLGVHLVAAIEAFAAARGVRTLTLLTTTAPAFFARLGYKRIERNQVPAALAGTAEFRSLCPASAVCMAKSIA